MHEIVGRDARAFKTTRHVIEFLCYIDTIIVFFPVVALCKTDWRWLCELYGAKPHFYRNRKKIYLLVAFQCPQRALLREIANLCDKYCGCLYRLDIACDVIRDPNMSPQEQFRFIKEHMLLMHRDAQRILPVRNADGSTGYYFVKHAHLNGAPRDICAYWDLLSKLIEGFKPAHLDFRMRGAPIRHIDPHDLEFLDPSEILLQHLRFVEFDRTRFERRLFRKTIREANNKAEAVALISKMRRHDQLDWVQRVHDQHRVRLRTNNDLVRFPTAFTWGAKRRSVGRKEIMKEIRTLDVENCILDAHGHGA
ncbi:hypothetical protein EAS54_38995 [Bradyrhizobium guangzhouense]|nr:hypothetical protein EAS54_38995 [Bradyrhizobium guangzhouense]